MSPRITPENRIPDIVRAAFVVFGENGYRKTKMEDIADEAGVSKGTLYYYFVSKAHLFLYLLENGVIKPGEDIPSPEDWAGVSEWDILEKMGVKLRSISKMEGIKPLIENVGRNAIDLEGELKKMIGEMWDILEKNRIMISLLERSHTDFPDLTNLFNVRVTGRMMKMFEDYLKTCIKHDATRPLSSVPLYSRMLIETLSWFGWKRYRDGGADVISRDDIVSELASFFARGLKAD
jgi:AcrR family transcriptional regulator